MNPTPNPFEEDDPFDDDPFTEVEQEMRIHKLKNEIREITGGFHEHESQDTPSEVREGFWGYMDDWERAPDIKLKDEWEKNHAPLPGEGELSDEQISVVLWESIHWLAERRNYIEWTDHLSDRELLAFIRDVVMVEWTKIVAGTNCNWSPTGGGSEEDIYIQLKYYADDGWRSWWKEDFPEDEIPERETPPYDRDKDLPRPSYEVEEWEDEDEAEPA